MLKIYFCGSIRGGRELSGTYQEIIAMLQKYGEVLTEHVGNESVIEIESASLSDEEIYKRDLKWLMDSDLIVAEVSVPSLGVGYEIGFSVWAGKTVLCLFNRKSEKQLSAMIAGCRDITVIDYSSVSEVEEAVRTYILRNAGNHNP